MDAEVGVIGVGTVGSMAMLEIARSGKSVLGFEQFWIGHDRSAGAGDTRLFRTPHSVTYKSMYRDAFSLWRQLEAETDQELLTLGKALIIGESDSDFLTKAIQNLNDYQSKYEILERKQAEIVYPQHKLLPNEIVIEEESAGFLRPELSILAAVERAKELGGQVLSHTRVERIEPFEDHVRIWANDKEYKVRKLIITAGPWTSKILSYGEIIKPRKLVSTWFLPKDQNEFSPERFPVFIRMNQEFGVYGTPSVNRSMVKVAIRNESNELEDADNLDPQVSSEEIDRMSDIIQRALPGLYSTPTRVTSYMDSYTIDQQPIVSKLPNQDNIVLLSGYSGHGFKLAPVMGRIAAELTLEGESAYPIESLSFNRFDVSKSNIVY